MFKTTYLDQSPFISRTSLKRPNLFPCTCAIDPNVAILRDSQNVLMPMVDFHVEKSRFSRRVIHSQKLDAVCGLKSVQNQINLFCVIVITYIIAGTEYEAFVSTTRDHAQVIA